MTVSGLKVGEVPGASAAADSEPATDVPHHVTRAAMQRSGAELLPLLAPLSPEQRYSVALQVAKRDYSSTMGDTTPLRRMGLPRGRLFEVMVRAADVDATVIAELPRAGFNADERLAVALAGLRRSGFAIGHRIASLALPHAQRLELARRLAVDHCNGEPPNFASFRKACGAKDRDFTQDECFELAMMSAKAGVISIPEYLEQYGLTQAQNHEVAYTLAANRVYYEVLKHQDKFAFDERQATRVTDQAIRSGMLPERFFDIQDVRRQRHLGKLATRTVAVERMLSWGRDLSSIPIAMADIIIPYLAGQVGLPKLLGYCGADWKGCDQLPLESLRNRLRDYSALYPQRLPAKAVELAWDNVQRIDTGVDVLQLAMRQRHDIPATAQEVLARATKLPLDRPLSSEAAHDAYTFLGEIQTRVSEPLFTSCRFEPALLADKRLATLRPFLFALRNNFMLRGGTDAAWGELARAWLVGNDTFDAAAVRATTAAVEADTLGRVSALFETDRLALDGLGTLMQRRRALDTFLTLAARYAGEPAWKACIPVLGRILSAEASGSFAQYKFAGFPGDTLDADEAARQLACLATPEQKAAWCKPRHRIVVDDGQAPPTQGTPLAERVRTELETTLLAHLPQVGTSAEALRLATAALQSEGNPSSAAQTLLGMGDPARMLAAIAHTTRLAAKRGALGEVRRAIAILQFLSGRHGEVFGDMLVQIREDTTSLALTLKPSTSERKKSVMVTLLASDALSLLEVGDMVRTASCQNFKSGAYIQALPGYVIDANVQALLTFALDESCFATPQDFARVVSGRDATPVFNPDDRSITFAFPGGDTILSGPIGYAHRRNILKLGTATDGAPALLAERAYEQTHPGSALMESSHAQVIDELAGELGARRSGSASFPASRNALGVYCDCKGGIEARGYAVDL